MKDNKKTIILTIVGVITLILVAVGATYAYFTAQGGAASQTDISVKTSTTDSLVFSTGDDISFTAIQSTFKKGDGNKAGSTYAKAVLKANDSTNHATANYYVYLNITNNNFEYTTETNTAELILTVIGPDGNPVTEIEGLDYVTVNGISGFDVTIKSGLLKLVDNHEIVSEGTKEENWNITLTLVNLDSDQSKNAGKNFNASIEITKETTAFHETCNDDTLACHVAKTFTGTQGENNIYYHNASLANGAGDNSYRYAGAGDSTNNYVCFGTNETTCSTDNLYRIIGVFGNNVKLIKSESIGQMSWSDSGFNTWSESTLNAYLNSTYLTSLGEYANKIATYTWKVGGSNAAGVNKVTPAEAYKSEIINPDPLNTTDNKTEYEGKVGLMYLTDYAFSASSSAWTTLMTEYYADEIKSVNWMYTGLKELTIFRLNSTEGRIITVKDGKFTSLTITYEYDVRPAFYLESSVNYVSGSGTQADPYIIN